MRIGTEPSSNRPSRPILEISCLFLPINDYFSVIKYAVLETDVGIVFGTGRRKGLKKQFDLF